MPYREERHALEERLASLEKELAEVRARAGELADLQKAEKRLAAEVASVQRTMRELDAGRRRLPTLDTIRIASPCSARWDEMIGDERVRFCAHCEKNVYNLSAMTRPEAEALLVEKEGKLCARMYQRKDDTVMTADCPVGVRARRVKRIAAVALGVGGLATLATFGVGFVRMGKPAHVGELRPVTGKPVPPEMGTATAEPVQEHTMGAVAPMPAPSASATSPRSAGAK